MKKKVILIVIILLVIIFCFSKAIKYYSIDRSGKLLQEGIIFKDEEYTEIDYAFTKEGKTIGMADSWEIKEIPEDKNHNFLAVRNFLDNFYVVKKSYTIPTEGNIGVVYIDRKRYTDNEWINAINYLLNEELNEKFYIKTNNIAHYAKTVRVGYEDCPVGTKYVGMVGNINDKLVYIKPKKYEYGEEVIFCCYIVTGSARATLEKYPYYIKDTAEIAIQ